MALTRVERERIADSRLKLQSAANALNHINPKNVPDFDDIQACLDDAEKSLGSALRSAESDAPRKK